MKMQEAVVISALLLGSGIALAAGGAGGAGNAGGGAGAGGGGAGAGSSGGHGGGAAAASAGGTDGAMSAGSGTSPTTKTHTPRKRTHSSTSKPMNDTTNTPGADASSDTKGH